MRVDWNGVFQVLAFCFGWGAALDSPHPIGAFLGTWFTCAAVFWFLGLMIAFDRRGGKTSGEGSGSNGEGGSGGGA
jgi:hypothetical protein